MGRVVARLPSLLEMRNGYLLPDILVFGGVSASKRVDGAGMASALLSLFD